MTYQEKNREALKEELDRLLSIYHKSRAKGLSLDLSRGKPNGEQLSLTDGLLDLPLLSEGARSRDGIDCRNYGAFDGLSEMKELLGEIYGIDPARIFVGGNSSLQLMYDALARAMLFGVPGGEPWVLEPGRKWICVVPGYDRHFRVTEEFGFELLSVPMTPDGPDMDTVERLAADPAVKGIWCVPNYSNPTGNTYTETTVRRLVAMKTAAPDFRIFWDNAYAVHDATEQGDTLADIFALAKEYGTEDRVLYFGSTSKISFPGGGVAMVAASERNLADIRARVGVETIGYDKINQLRHVRYFRDGKNVREHMKKLGKCVREKFDIALTELSALDGCGIASYTNPRGGYFISLDVLPGTAKRVYALCRDAGVILTPAGATYPYGKDPEDKNLRLAPTYPTSDDLRAATKILVLAVKIAALEKLLASEA
ncbi:MAG TPA: aminotransferase [Clostridiales bacterium]|nr:aminotransferase [Clostridiales bacterium]